MLGPGRKPGTEPGHQLGASEATCHMKVSLASPGRPRLAKAALGRIKIPRRPSVFDNGVL